MALEIKVEGDAKKIYRNGKLEGTITKKGRRFEWYSTDAKEPYRHGTGDSEAEALAHLGFKHKP